MKAASRADWGIDAYPSAEKNRRSWTVAAVAVVVVVVLVTLVALPLGIVPALVLGAVTLAAALWWIMQQGSLALRSTRARPVDETRFPRFVNVASGLARDLGIEMPRLFVIEKGEPNALVTRSRTPVIAMTTALLDGFTRTELEAVVAHCLERIATKELDNALVAIALGPLGRGVVPRVGYDDDVRAVALTRFPPALASAVGKAIPTTGRYAPLWFVAEHPAHRSIGDRIAAIEDL